MGSPLLTGAGSPGSLAKGHIWHNGHLAQRPFGTKEGLPFLVLPDLLSRGEVFYNGQPVVNQGIPDKGMFDPRSLRVRDPWDF